MKVMVTGGAGYIGSACVEWLLNQGLEVLVYDNLSEGHRQAIDPRALFMEGDLSDSQFLSHALQRFQPSGILHLAASALVGESMQNPGKYFKNNVSNGLNLLECAVQHQVSKIVFSSTCAVYGPPPEIPIHENLPTAPVNPYGESKRMFEAMLRWYHEIHGLQSVVFRYFNAAGATPRYGEHHRIETHLIPNILQVAQGIKPHIDIFGTRYPTPDGTCVRDYIHISDLAQAHALALTQDIQGTFNLGTETGCSVREAIQHCEAITGRSIPVNEQPARPGDPPILIASAQKARQILGWTPRYTRIQDIIQTAWDWRQAHPHGYA